MKIDLTHILGKPFRMGGRGPDAYDCIGVCREVALQVHGEEAADTLPCGELSCVVPEEFPGEWHYVGNDASMPTPGDAVLTERTNERGEIEHHVYTAVGSSKFATSDRKRGACVVPLRAIQEDVIGVYRWRPIA